MISKDNKLFARLRTPSTKFILASTLHNITPIYVNWELVLFSTNFEQ